jgi:hypothetical protein
MGVATVVEVTPGIRRYQVLQTAADVLTVRIDHDPASDRAAVWQAVRAGLADLLRAHGAVNVRLRLADEPSQVDRAAESSGTCCGRCPRWVVGGEYRKGTKASGDRGDDHKVEDRGHPRTPYSPIT